MKGRCALGVRALRLLVSACAGVVLAGALAVVAAPGPAGAATVTGGPPPAVPSTGAYLGVWLNPNVPTTTTSDLLRSVQLLSDFDARMGRPMGFVHLFQQGNLNKHSPVSDGTLRAVAATGAVPMIDWPCALTDTQIADGAMDASIRKFAHQLAGYGGPVFIRWSWEMNLNKLPGNKACQATAGPQGYIDAFRHIETIFAQIASNVAFVWCPSAAPVSTPAATYFPGASYVDWIGFDGYDRTTTPTGPIAHWQSFYDEFSTYAKPMVIAETGDPYGNTTPNDQAQFLAAVEAVLPSMPEIKAVGYYDSETTSNNWTLNGGGLDQLRALGEDPYFSFVDPLGAPVPAAPGAARPTQSGGPHR